MLLMELASLGARQQIGLDNFTMAGLIPKSIAKRCNPTSY